MIWIALERLLKKNKTKKKKLIVTDGVFSMDGDLADIPKLVQLAQKYDAYLYIDDAHGYGVLGKKWTRNTWSIMKTQVQ